MENLKKYYPTALGSGKSFHMVIPAAAVRELGIENRDEIEVMFVRKTGTQKPKRKGETLFARRAREFKKEPPSFRQAAKLAEAEPVEKPQADIPASLRTDLPEEKEVVRVERPVDEPPTVTRVPTINETEEGPA